MCLQKTKVNVWYVLKIYNKVTQLQDYHAYVYTTKGKLFPLSFSGLCHTILTELYQWFIIKEVVNKENLHHLQY